MIKFTGTRGCPDLPGDAYDIWINPYAVVMVQEGNYYHDAKGNKVAATCVHMTCPGPTVDVLGKVEDVVRKIEEGKQPIGVML